MASEGKGSGSDNIKDISESEELNIIRRQLALCVKENERLVDELKNFRHNTLNILHSINGYIELRDWDGLKKHFYDIIENSKRIFDTNLSSIEKINNSSLKKLLLAKLEIAVGTGIDFKVMAYENILIETELISENDLCRVTGEFLDNAIEAASMAHIKKVSVYLFINENSISIIVENTFKEKPTVSKKIAESPTKGEGGGLRLHSVSTILSKYPHILNNTFVQHQVFVQELQIIK